MGILIGICGSFILASLCAFFWVRGIDYMKENHPYYEGDEFFNNQSTLSEIGQCDYKHLKNNQMIQEEINEEENLQYHLDRIRTIEAELKEQQARVMASGIRLALTNPEIYTKADLISKDDALGFAEWVSNDTFYVYLPISEKWSNGNDMKSSEELFTLYQQLK